MISPEKREMFMEALMHHTEPLWTRSGPRFLTGREIVVLSLLVLGFSNDEIGKHLDITVYRVRQITERVRRSIFKTKEWSEVKRKNPTIMDIATTSIDVFDLTIRSSNCLKSENIYTIGELVRKTEQDLLKIPFFGRKSLNEIKDALRQRGLNLHSNQPLMFSGDTQPTSKG